jgi:hypothetical protein
MALWRGKSLCFAAAAAELIRLLLPLLGVGNSHGSSDSSLRARALLDGRAAPDRRAPPAQITDIRIAGNERLEVFRAKTSKGGMGGRWRVALLWGLRTGR